MVKILWKDFPSLIPPCPSLGHCPYGLMGIRGKAGMGRIKEGQMEGGGHSAERVSLIHTSKPCLHQKFLGGSINFRHIFKP